MSTGGVTCGQMNSVLVGSGVFIGLNRHGATSSASHPKKMLQSVNMRPAKFLTGCLVPSNLLFEPEEVLLLSLLPFGASEFRNSPLCMFLLPSINPTRLASYEFHGAVLGDADNGLCDSTDAGLHGSPLANNPVR